MTSGPTSIAPPPNSKKTVGLLYPGEMGAALAGVLVASGVRVVTTLRDRTDATRRRAAAAKVEILDSLADVARVSDVVLSVVSPAAAEETVEAYCRCADLAPPSALFVDVNSTGPELAQRLAELVGAAGRGFVDAAVNGLAKNLTSGATLFLSGTRSPEVAELFEKGVTVRVLGNEPGRASAMKMLLGGLSKGTCALFLELALLAERREMLPEMLAECGRIYPGITALVDRMLPTYVQHAARRAEEMRELLETAVAGGLEPCLLDAVSRMHEMMAGAFDAPPDGEKGTAGNAISGEGGVTPFVRRAAGLGLLQPESVIVVESASSGAKGAK